MKKYVVFLVLYYSFIALHQLHSDSTANSFSFKVLDVGQGDALVIQTKKLNFLIDMGPSGAIQKHLVDLFGINCNLEMVFITHLHEDHFGSINDVIDKCKIKSLWFNDISLSSRVYARFKEKIKNNKKINQVNTVIYDDLIFEYGLLKIFVLWPNQKFVNDFKTNDDLNQLSTVLFVDYGNFEALLTGDAESEVLESLDWSKITLFLDDGLDVLKVPHHGSKKGLSPGLLAVLKPKVCVISVGSPNQYGHPTDYTLSLLKSAECKVLRTDELGTIEFNLK